jgi:hypothetical protein
LVPARPIAGGIETPEEKPYDPEKSRDEARKIITY